MPVTFRSIGTWFGNALDRAVTVAGRHWPVLVVAWALVCINDLLGANVVISYAITIAWAVVAPTLAAKDVIHGFEPSRAAVGKFVVAAAEYTVVAVLMLSPVAIFIVLVLHNNARASASVLYLAIFLWIFATARYALGPLIALLDNRPAGAAFSESLSLTSGKFLLTATSVALGWLSTVLPFWWFATACITVVDWLHIRVGDGSDLAQERFARALGEPLLLYGSIAFQLMLIRLLSMFRSEKAIEDPVVAATRGDAQGDVLRR